MATEKALLVHACHQDLYPETAVDLATAISLQPSERILSLLDKDLDDETREIIYRFIKHGGETIRRNMEAGSWWADARDSNWTSGMNGVTIDRSTHATIATSCCCRSCTPIANRGMRWNG